MKGRVIFQTLGLVFLGLLVFYVISKLLGKNNLPEDNKGGVLDFPDEPIPDVTPPNTENQNPIPSNSPIVFERMRQIFRNQSERNKVLSLITLPAYNTEHSGAIRESLVKSGFSEIPIVPEFIAPTYDNEIEAFLSLPAFEEIDKRSGTGEAEKVYSSAMNFESVQLPLWTGLRHVATGGGFGQVNGKSRSWNKTFGLNNGVKEFKKMFTQVLKSNKEFEDALKTEAINQIRKAGYKVEGYDV